MASLNRAQLIDHFYALRRAYYWCYKSKSRDGKLIAQKLKSIAMDIEQVIGQMESRPASAWGEGE